MPAGPVYAEQFSDFGTTTQVSGGTTAPASNTPETWVVTSSSSFPALSNGAQAFYVADPAAPSELVLVYAIAGTSWSVIRGAQGTATVAHSSGFTINQVISPQWYQQVSSPGLPYAIAAGLMRP